jgi:HEAT repeat protein
MKVKMNRREWTDDKLLTHLLNNKSDRTRWDNIRALRSRPSEELFLKCVDLVKSKKHKSRTLGIDILAQLGTPPRPFLKRTIRLYFDLLDNEKNFEVLMSLLYAIGHNNEKLSKAQVDKLCSFANTENNFVKEGLVSALLGVDDLKVIGTLIELSTDKLNHIRNWATFGIGTQTARNSKKIRDALWDRVSDKHQETKLEAILGLAKRKDKRVNEIIKKELIEGEYGTLLLEAIIETGDKQFLPLLRQNLKLGNVDRGVNPDWLIDLRKCIADLNEKGTAA